MTFLLLGTVLAFWPLLRKPEHFSGYVFPRYIVPLGIWFTGFFPAIQLLYYPEERPIYRQALEEYQDQALVYLVLCLVMFWLGFMIPLRWRSLSRMLQSTSADLDYVQLLRVGAFLVGIGTATFLMVVQGDLLWSNKSWQPVALGPIGSYVKGQMVLPLNVLAVVAYGLAWPGRGSRGGVIIWIGALLLIGLTSLPLMAQFSRAAGLMPVFMLVGYVARWGRIPVWATALVILNLMYAGHVGLSGRGYYGHYAGVLPFLEHYISGSDFSRESHGMVLAATGSLTPLTICMTVYHMQADVQQISPINWLIFQIPVPHMAGIGGSYTLNLAYYLGGAGRWNYTASMYGDTFVHLGWWGCVPFAYMGMLYRLLENTLVECRGRGGALGIVALTILPVSYAALAQGAFNTFRGWNSMFTFGLGMAIMFFWFLGRLSPSRLSESASPMPALQT